ncbi:MAG: hypothetical protein M5R36_03030 [Deltaproteobacteria bacterium]|nr:hypothetical protein [Deltaproteobacteria bacterium]
MTHRFWMILALAAIFAMGAMAVACGDDDDDDDDGPAEDASNQEACEFYAEELFGEDGCQPDDTFYTSVFDDDCPTMNDRPQEDVDAFFECLDAIVCDDFDDSTALYSEGYGPCLGVFGA